MSNFENNIRQTWDLVYTPGCAVEIRAFLKTSAKVGGKFSNIVSGYFDNYEAFRAAAMEAEKLKPGAVYVTLNPVKHDLTARAYNRLIGTDNKAPTTSDKDIIGRRLVLIDADPLRPSGISSTDTELAAALAVRDEVAAYLHEQGFPHLADGMSGNGGHLLGRIDLPNDEQSEGIVKDFLQCLDLKFGRGRAGAVVGIDTTVYNAARITKLYGTTARKGDSTPTRPHRDSYLGSVPEMEVIPIELLQRVADEYRAHKVTTTAPAKAKTVTSTAAPANWSDSVDGVERYLADHGVTLQAAESYSADGYQYKWVVDCVTSAGAHKDGAAIMWGAGKGLGYKCHHDSCNGKSWADVRAIIDPKPIYTNGHYNGFGPANVEINIQPAPAEAQPEEEPVTSGFVGVVAELLRVVIDAGGEIDTLRDAVARLSDNDRKQPPIIAQLERVFAKPEKLKQWLSDCGYHGESMSKAWLTQLHRLGYHFKMNQLDDSIEVSGAIMTDGLESEIRCAMRDRDVKNMDALKDAYRMEAYHNSYHPIKDFLGALEWDGADHIETLASYFTASQSTDEGIIPTYIDYSDGRRLGVFHAFLKRWLVGTVAKVYQQAQNFTLTMAGPQGIGKSYVAKWLCSPMADFFNEGQLEPDGKETDRRLATTWIWEIGELGATTRRSDVNALKNKLTQSTVKFRVPYGHNDVIKPVLTSFFGTVNPDGRGFLMDKTGNRRFAVVNIKSINFAYADLDPRQVWAQAMALYRAGEPWRLTKEEETAQQRINKEHESEETIDMIMPELFILTPGTDSPATAPIDIAQELYYKNYAKDLDKCAKDAAAWLKANGYVKKGKPATWRGIALRFPKAKPSHSGLPGDGE